MIVLEEGMARNLSLESDIQRTFGTNPCLGKQPAKAERLPVSIGQLSIRNLVGPGWGIWGSQPHYFSTWTLGVGHTSV